jgi:hypothetical protein
MGPVAYYLYRDAKSYQAGQPPLHTKFGPYASMKEAEAKREEEESGARRRIRLSLPHRCGTDTHSKVAHYPAGITDRLWDVNDVVALWESSEWRAERAA